MYCIVIVLSHILLMIVQGLQSIMVLFLSRLLESQFLKLTGSFRLTEPTSF